MGTVYPESGTTDNRILTKLTFLYGAEHAESVYRQISELIGAAPQPPRKPLD
ncbi:MAG: hypothetical protein ABI835_09035 [Chloroflexota bacterium]